MRKHVLAVARVTAAAILILGITACGDDEEGSGSSTSTTPSEPGAPGVDPVVIGLITTLEGDFPSIEIKDAAEVAVAYLNEERGGIAGRPIELVVCGTASTVESSSSCANELVDERPALVVGGLDTSAAASVPIFAQAGVPYVTSYSTVTEELNCDTCFAFNGSTTDIGRAFITDFKDRGTEKAVIIHSQIPAGQVAAEGFKAFAESQGISVDLVPSPVESPDASVALTTATRADPDAIVVLTGRPQCVSVMTTSEQIGVEADMYYAPSCANPETIEAGGTGAEGARFSSPFVSPDDVSNEDVALFREQMEERSPDTIVYVNPQSVFSTFMTLASALEDLEGDDITAESVLQALRTTAEVPIFMGADDATITCDGSASERFPAVCSTSVMVLTHDGEILVAG